MGYRNFNSFFGFLDLKVYAGHILMGKGLDGDGETVSYFFPDLAGSLHRLIQ